MVERLIRQKSVLISSFRSEAKKCIKWLEPIIKSGWRVRIFLYYGLWGESKSKEGRGFLFHCLTPTPGKE